MTKTLCNKPKKERQHLNIVPCVDLKVFRRHLGHNQILKNKFRLFTLEILRKPYEKIEQYQNTFYSHLEPTASFVFSKVAFILQSICLKNVKDRVSLICFYYCIVKKEKFRLKC